MGLGRNLEFVLGTTTTKSFTESKAERTKEIPLWTITASLASPLFISYDTSLWDDGDFCSLSKKVKICSVNLVLLRLGFYRLLVFVIQKVRKAHATRSFEKIFRRSLCFTVSTVHIIALRHTIHCAAW